MNSQPTFSVIIPTYNQADYLKQALDSLLAQTDVDWEAVVVNDGSTDATAEVMQSYAELDRRIRIFHKQNGGTGSALNEGLRQAYGDWICWLSSDDLFDPRKLEIHRRYMEREPQTSFFYTHYYKLFEENNRLTTPHLWREIPEREWQVLEMFRGSFVHGISICVKREAMKTVHAFDETLRYAQDYDMWLRLLIHYPATFIPERTCIQRVHGGQTTHSFYDALFFDSSRASINLLNQHPFEELVPIVDLSDPVMAKNAITKAMDIACAFDSRFLYALGPHLALLSRILEWFFRYEQNFGAKNHSVTSIRMLLEKRMQDVLKSRYLDPAIKLQWKAAYASLKLSWGEYRYAEQTAVEIAKKRYWQLVAIKKESLKPLGRYIEHLGHKLDPISVPSPLRLGEVIIVSNKDSEEDRHSQDELPALQALTNDLMRIGKQVLLVDVPNGRTVLRDNQLSLAMQSEANLASLLRLLSPFDALIAVSRADVFHFSTAERPLLFQTGENLSLHNDDISLIQRDKIPVVVSSQAAQDFFRQQGISQQHIHLISMRTPMPTPMGKDDQGDLQHRISEQGIGEQIATILGPLSTIKRLLFLERLLWETTAQSVSKAERPIRRLRRKMSKLRSSIVHYLHPNGVG